MNSLVDLGNVGRVVRRCPSVAVWKTGRWVVDGLANTTGSKRMDRRGAVVVDVVEGRVVGGAAVVVVVVDVVDVVDVDVEDVVDEDVEVEFGTVGVVGTGTGTSICSTLTGSAVELMAVVVSTAPSLDFSKPG
jgi:hypothetical protein